MSEQQQNGTELTYEEARDALEDGKSIGELLQTPAVEQPAAPSEPEKPSGEGESPAPAPAGADQNEIAALKAHIREVEKRLSDTRNWGRGVASQLKQMKSEMAKATTSNDSKPYLLNDMEGLEEAIRYVNGAGNGSSRDTQPSPDAAPQDDGLDLPDESSGKDAWMARVTEAIPDIETRLTDAAFMASVQKARTEMGVAWDDPSRAIRRMESMIREQETAALVRTAVETAVASERERAERSRVADIPRGGGRRTEQTPLPKSITDLTPEEIHSMPREKFERLKNRHLMN